MTPVSFGGEAVLTLYLIASGLIGGGISFAYRLFFPAISTPAQGGLDWLIGGALGAGIAFLIRLAFIRIAPLLQEEGAEIRTVNGLLLALGSAPIGVILYFSLAAVFPPGEAVRIAQGIVLFASAAVGFKVGWAFDSPLWGGSGGATATRNPRKAVGRSKILDTSVIIDGRIGDLLSTGFIDGKILVPEFVLGELQNIADSSNSLRRRKGRRGLEILRKLMDEDGVDLRVVSHDYPSIREVDRKLIRLAKEEDASLITTDYNLNRVAQVEGVDILNVNELANAVKPRFIPGEAISVEVIDRGEEINQGVGYLDDGTMVVVENGRRHIGRTIKATVKTTLQTDAGRMLFVEPAGEGSRWER